MGKRPEVEEEVKLLSELAKLISLGEYNMSN
jgi:hypothetical protein